MQTSLQSFVVFTRIDSFLQKGGGRCVFGWAVWQAGHIQSREKKVSLPLGRLLLVFSSRESRAKRKNRRNVKLFAGFLGCLYSFCFVLLKENKLIKQTEKWLWLAKLK